METNEYQELTGRTESIPDGTARPFIPHPVAGYVGIPISLLRIIHHVLGVASEAGELADQLKRHMYYSTADKSVPLDEANLMEETGDLSWYVARLNDVLGYHLDSVHKRNINKLKVRYPEKFSTEAATNRDLAAERRVLEQSTENRKSVISRDSSPLPADKPQPCTCGGIVLDNGSGMCDACYEEYMVKMHRTRPMTRLD